MPENELKASISELHKIIKTLNENTTSLDKRIEVFIQKSESESQAFKAFMDRTDRVISKLNNDVHSLQISRAESKSIDDDMKEIKRVIVRWVAGGLVASACGIMAIVLAYFKVNTGG